jgi:hypothetical protein
LADAPRDGWALHYPNPVLVAVNGNRKFHPVRLSGLSSIFKTLPFSL